MIYWIAISAISTGVIAVFSIVSFFLARSIKAKNDEYQKQINDLFQAIAISNILSTEHPVGSAAMEKKVLQFNQWYEGDIQIFPKENIFEPRR